MEWIRQVNQTLAVIFTVCYFYQVVYVVISLINVRSKEKQAVSLHRFAVLIAARNEEAVIGQLIESIHAQDYPAELLDIYVVADNCTDHTANRAWEFGAVVKERFDQSHVGKGYALNWLLEELRKEGHWETYDGYLVLDADNLLEENYLTEMNRTFSLGYDILTSYRNAKNFGDNWLTAGYALWFLREARYLNQARMRCGTSCAVSGTGFLFGKRILKKYDGWNFFLLTEDIQFTMQMIVDGERIGYCKDAILYDEQPTSFAQSWRQRMRWAKGNLQVFMRYFGKLGKGILRGSFACFDMFMSLTPLVVLTAVGIVLNGIALVDMTRHGFGPGAALQEIGWLCVCAYGTMFLTGLLTTITEWKRIHCSAMRKLWSTVTFPVFLLTYVPITMVALFRKVEWLPIHHREAKGLQDVRRRD